MTEPTIAFATLENCPYARGVVVVIDVVRAFTTAAFAFAAGARRILLVGEVEQALALCTQVDRFNFIMPVERVDDLLVMEKKHAD